VLLGAGADPNGRGYHNVTPLDSAVFHLNDDPKQALIIIKLLLERRADPNVQTDDGYTALHFAVHAGSKDVVETLLAHGASVNVKNKSGETPLAVARKLRKASIAELLRKHGATE
jgi:hypothetical protein